jgi:hypothetical protein
MFIGHFALGLAAKRAAPRLSLAALLAAAQLADMMWPVLLPPSQTAIALVSLIGACLFIAWAGWVDRHREVVRA